MWSTAQTGARRHQRRTAATGLTLILTGVYTPSVFTQDQRSIRIAQTQAELIALMRLRIRVFVLEQGVPIALELDPFDADARQFIVQVGDEYVATARLVTQAARGRVGRMAVDRRFRHQGIGRALIESIILTAREQGLTTLELHAQEHAVVFYEKMGFETVGEAFVEASIPHWSMFRGLD